MKFSDLNLSDPILRSLQDQNYKEPTPIQAEVIPAILNKSDVMAAAQTGTGKTAGFVLPILSILSNPKNNYKGHQLRALIVTPTRELAANEALQQRRIRHDSSPAILQAELPGN